MIGIEADIEQRAAVARPGDTASSIGDGILQVAAGGDIAKAYSEQLRALVVDGIGQELMIRTMRGITESTSMTCLGLPGCRRSGCSSFVPATRAAHDARILAAGDVARKYTRSDHRAPGPSCRPL